MSILNFLVALCNSELTGANLDQAAAFARTVISCMSADDNWGYDRKGCVCGATV
jgi:hypothetical protein